MGELRASIYLDLAGNLQARAGQFASSLTDLSGRGQRSMGLLRSSMAAAGRGLDSLGNRYTALFSGAAGIGTVKMLMGTDAKFTRLGIAANKADDEIKKVKDSIYQVAQASDIRVDPAALFEGMYAIIEKTGDWEFAINNIRNIGMAIRAAGLEGRVAGDLIAEMPKMEIKDPRDVTAALDILINQGKAAAFPLEKLGALGPRVISLYAGMGRTGLPAIRGMGTALQMAYMGTGGAETAATAFEAFVAEVVGKSEQLKKVGVNVFEMVEGKAMMRSVPDLMDEIIRKSNADPRKLKSIFGEQSFRQLTALMAEFQKTGSTESLKQFYNVAGDGVTLHNDTARAAKTAEAALTSLSTAWKKVADEELSGPIKAAAEALNAIGPETTGRIIKGIAGVGVALGGLVLVRKAYLGARGIGEMIGRFRSGGALAGAAGSGGGLGGLPVPLPVYVVNSRMSLMPGQYGAGFSGRTAGNALSSSRAPGWLSRAGGLLQRAGASRWGRGAGWAGAAVGALASSADVADAWTDDQVPARQAWGRTARAGLNLGGTALGATIGSFLLPGLGTMLGGLAGGWLGDLAGGYAEKLIGREGSDDMAAKIGREVAAALNEKEGKLVIEMKGEGKVRSAQSRGFEFDVDTGAYMAGTGN